MKHNVALALLAALGINAAWFKTGKSRSHTKRGPGREHNTDISERNLREVRPVGKIARGFARHTA